MQFIVFRHLVLQHVQSRRVSVQGAKMTVEEKDLVDKAIPRLHEV